MIKIFDITLVVALLSATAHGFNPIASPTIRRTVAVSATMNNEGDVSRRRFVSGMALVVPAIFAAAPAFAVSKEAAIKEKVEATSLQVAVGGAGSFQGVYIDPNHPKGYRVIRETKVGKIPAAILELQDEPGADVVSITAKTQINKKTGDLTLKIDFSSKGGPKNLPGVYKDGTVTFPDGNVWTKATGYEGVYSDPNHKEGYRVIRSAGPKGAVTLVLQDGPSEPILEIPAVAKTKKSPKTKTLETTIVLDFSAKGGPKNIPGVVKGDQIVFPDGNAWQKL